MTVYQFYLDASNTANVGGKMIITQRPTTKLTRTELQNRIINPATNDEDVQFHSGRKYIAIKSKQTVSTVITFAAVAPTVYSWDDGSKGCDPGCCFIMLEARYGNGTMDRVVRRYRDEKVTERNKRGYYKLAEVFIPLMRKSKLFSFFVVKTFVDPAVCYAKWYYGENKWGWVFKPLERFWMGLFDTLGSDTKFIRENGEVV
jgi:hypothetical protein